MVDKKDDLREVMKGQLKGRTEELRQWVANILDGDKSWSKSKTRLGADMLKTMLAEPNGEELLNQFTEWTVHPRSGFLPQTQRAKPLPDELHRHFEKQANRINKTVGEQHLPNAPAPLDYYPEHRVLIDELTLAASRVLEGFLTPEQAEEKSIRGR